MAIVPSPEERPSALARVRARVLDRWRRLRQAINSVVEVRRQRRFVVDLSPNQPLRLVLWAIDKSLVPLEAWLGAQGDGLLLIAVRGLHLAVSALRAVV